MCQLEEARSRRFTPFVDVDQGRSKLDLYQVMNDQQNAIAATESHSYFSTCSACLRHGTDVT